MAPCQGFVNVTSSENPYDVTHRGCLDGLMYDTSRDTARKAARSRVMERNLRVNIRFGGTIWSRINYSRGLEMPTVQ